MPLRRVCAVKGMNTASVGAFVALDGSVLLLGERDDGSSFRRLVRQRGELGRLGKLALLDALQRQELGRLAVAERDGAGLVEQQRVHIAGRFDGATGHGEHVETHQSVHAGDADGRQQRTDGGRNQRHEQRDQHQHADMAAGIGGKLGIVATAKTKISVIPASRMLSAIVGGLLP